MVKKDFVSMSIPIHDMVSIVIPVYNGSDFLAQAIESALAQSYPECEVLVINDGSDDNGATRAIALSYDGKVRYFEKENGGVATALNMGISQMKGNYFSWLSHDDFYYPKKIEQQMNAIAACGDKEKIVISDYDIRDENRNNISHFRMGELYDRSQIENSVFSVMQGLVSGCAMLIHKKHFSRVGLFDTTLKTTQDYQKWFELFRGQKLLYLPECLTVMRVHSGQGSKTIDCHQKERNELYMHFINSLMDDEIVAMYGSKGVFYSQQLSLLYGGGLMETYEHVHQMYLSQPEPEGLNDRLTMFKKQLFAKTQGKSNRVCIFGVGDWGLRLFQELNFRGVRVDYFCDNNPQKHGQIKTGIECIPLERLCLIKDQTLVVVAVAGPDPIVAQLQVLDFPYITTRQELLRLLFEVPRIQK